ncbi:MAG TPA: hypothetical protein VGU23_01850 [Acidobacteriaceae bacterium]|nr:hypothetical protein [Acidobacteriaceae bacterium]
MSPSEKHKFRFEWIFSVLNHSELSDGTKVTAVALALHLNIASGRLDPSIERLAKMTAQTTRGVCRQTRCLRKFGFIVLRENPARRSNSYQLTLPTGGSPASGSVANSSLDDAGTLAVNDEVAEPGPESHPNNEDNNSEYSLDERFRAFRRTLDERTWNSLFRDVRFEIGRQIVIVFRSDFYRNLILGKYGAKLADYFGEYKTRVD